MYVDIIYKFNSSILDVNVFLYTAAKFEFAPWLIPWCFAAYTNKTQFLPHTMLPSFR